jgi:hypothetical protein
MCDQLVARPLPVNKHRKTHTHTQTLNIDALNGIRTDDSGFKTSKTVHTLDRSATVTGQGQLYLYLTLGKLEFHHYELLRCVVNETSFYFHQVICRVCNSCLQNFDYTWQISVSLVLISCCCTCSCCGCLLIQISQLETLIPLEVNYVSITFFPWKYTDSRLRTA